MKNIKLLFVLTIILCVTLQCLGQNPTALNLEQCIEYAIKNNIDIKQQRLKVEATQNTLRQSKSALLPNLNSSFSHGFSFGRNIDPFSNTFVENNISANSLGLSSTITIFNGFLLKNQIKQNAINLSAENENIASQKNRLRIDVMLAYMEVLLNQELLKSTQEQSIKIRTQLERVKGMVEEGALSKTNIIDLNAQLSSSEFETINAKTNYDLAKLSLSQKLNWRETKSLEIISIEVKEPTDILSGEDIKLEVQQAIKQNASIKVLDFRLKSSVLGVEMARSGFYPTISLGVGIGSAYSSAAPSKRFIADGTGEKLTSSISSSQFVMLNDKKYPITNITPSVNGYYQNFTYFDQLNFNLNKFIRFNISIPIFNNHLTKTRMANALINQRSFEYDLQKGQQYLRYEIEQEYARLVASFEKFKSAKLQAETQQLAFESASSRFEEGLIHSIELNNFRVNLEKAKSSLIQTKYEYAFRKMIIEFY